MLSIAPRAVFAGALFVLFLGFASAHAQEVKPLVITGHLTKKDPFDKERKASHHKLHELELKTGRIYMIDLRSVDFDTVLRLEDMAGILIRELLVREQERISETSQSSRLGFVPKKTGTYRAVVTTSESGQIGRYTLQVGAMKKIGAPRVIAGKITEKSAKTTTDRSYELHKIEFKAGEFWQIDLTSKHIDPLLVAYTANLEPIACDENRDEGLNSRLVLGFVNTGKHALAAIAVGVGTKGDYTMRFQRLERTAALELTREERWWEEARALNRRGVELLDSHHYQEALDPLRQALEFAQRLYPKTTHPTGHRDLATSLDNLASLYRRQGDNAKAEPLYKQALEMRRQVLGEKHRKFATTLSHLARLYESQGDYAKAQPLHKQALEIYRQVLGEKHPHFAMSLNDLAILYVSQGDYAKAEPLYKQALEIYRQVLGENHPEFAATLSNLAILYTSQGDYAKAEPLQKQALEICRQVLGEKHRTFAMSLNNLAFLYQSQGDHAKAEPLFKQALEIHRQVLGEKHPDFAMSLNNLAALYQAQGDYAKAETLHKQALEIYRQVPGEKHPDFAMSLNNLAELHRLQGDYAKAEPLYKQALEIYRQVPGEKHTLFATSLNNLAALYQAQGNYAKAEPLHKQALEIYRQVLGEKHTNFARSLNNLAQVYQSQEDYAKAEPLLKQALEIRREVPGEKHPGFALILINLAFLYEAQADYAKAEPLARQAVLIMRRHLEASALVQSERQQIAYRATEDRYWSRYLGITAKQPDATTSTYDLALSWKGSVTARQRLTRIARTEMAKDPRAKELFNQLDQVSRLLSIWSSMPFDKLPKGIDLQKKLADLSAEREVVEGKLSAQTEGYRKFKQSQKLTTPELQKHLPEGTVLVDFFEYGDQLAAFVVTRDHVERIELQETKPIAEAVSRFRNTLKHSTPVTGKHDPALVLRQKLLDPLDKHLAEAKLLLISPVGPLTSLPFAALPGKNAAKYLIEEIPVATIPVPQMLPELLAKRDPARADALPSLLALGDVDFDGALVGLAQKIAEPEGWKRKRAGEAMKWNRLPGTRGEILAIEKIFRKAVPKGKLTVLRGGEPTEAAVRRFAPQHEYLHFATHGFFAPKEVKSALRLGDPKRAFEGDSLPRFIGHHPGLLSGIVLAGANLPKGDDDGVLTALEVSELDLTRVELAVLSACETGLGEVAGGEGVLGLQRAFQIAGARTTITSLWQVPDRATQALMQRFCMNLWEKKMTKLDALREAQLWLLREGRRQPDLLRGLHILETPDDAAGRFSPYYWAAFVLAGDWR